MDLAAEIAKKLLEIKAIKLSPSEPFTWASGMKSPIYCDNRITLSHPEVRNLIKMRLSELSSWFGPFDAVSGVATAGIAHGALLADLLEKPFSYIRSKPKAHGRQNLIEGRLVKGQKVLVVEDLISTGMSSLKAVDAVRDFGCEVVGVIAIFNYGFPKAVRAFKDHNCKFKTLSDYNVLISEALNQEYISKSEAGILQIWNDDPKKWAENNAKK